MSTTDALHQTAVHKTEALLFFTLLQLAVIVLAGRIGGLVARRVGQSTAVGEIIVGILLGPSLFGLLWPAGFDFVFRSAPPEPLTILSQIGLLLLMFQIGLEFDFSHLTEKRNRFAVMTVSITGLVAPFALGLAFGWLSAPALAQGADRIAYMLFVATSFSITALPILGRIMIEFDITRSVIGVITISAAAINDVVGWLLLAIVSALTVATLGGDGFSPGAFAINLGLVVAFVVGSWMLVRPPLKRVVRAFAPNAQRLPGMLLGIVLAGIFISGMTTYKLGIFAIFGGFMMGVLLHDEAGFVAAWKDKIGTFVEVFFIPIFFTYTGLRTDIGALASAQAWGWCVLVIALATLGKYGGCWIGARL
ncbi:MAG TPA: cation:proton antiporter, partial [Burkholderiaceae bacterium]|nr:cation:proton antiporter [Burkholderiaceae bacterium]